MWAVAPKGEKKVTGPMYLNMFRASILPAIHSSVGMSHFTFNKMAHHHTITETSEATSMKRYQVNG
jgi:hypothetical protein